MDKIKLRQICFLFAALMPVTKMIIYPATLCFYAKNDLLFSAAANFLLEGAVLALVILLAYRTDLTFFDLLKNTFGQAAARILYGLFALFFALSALLPILEQKGFVMQIFYENIPSLISFAPFFGVCIFACVKGFKTIGRAADIALPVFAVCFTVILLLSLPQADFSALLPVGGTGADGIFRGSLYGLNWYTDCLYPLFFSDTSSAKRAHGGRSGCPFSPARRPCSCFWARFTEFLPTSRCASRTPWRRYPNIPLRSPRSAGSICFSFSRSPSCSFLRSACPCR